MRRTLLLVGLMPMLAGCASAPPSDHVGISTTEVSTDSLVLPGKIGGVAVRWISPSEVVRSSFESVWSNSTQWSGRNPSAPVEALPQVIRSERPKYPNAAKLRGLEARVWVVALIDVDGTVLGARIGKRSEQDLGIGFETSALIAAMQNLYQPAKGGGESTKVWVTYPVDFVLRSRR
jgi:TonB family protein